MLYMTKGTYLKLIKYVLFLSKNYWIKLRNIYYLETNLNNIIRV